MELSKYNAQKTLNEASLIDDIKQIVRFARNKAYSAVNYAQVEQN